MPDRDVLEAQEISIVALLTEGEPKDTAVQFKIKTDDGKTQEESGTLKEDGSVTKASCKITAPAVPADKDKLVLTYTVVHEKRELSPAEKILIWPKEAKLVARDAEGKPLKGFAFKPVQPSKNPSPTALAANEQGESTFPLQPGEAFRIEAVAPFVISKTDATRKRELAITAERKFTAMFDAPVSPRNGQIKQYVNQARADDGQKGFGSRVKVRLMAKEDKNNTGTLVAGPGVFVYVTVSFGGAEKGWPSVRTDADKGLVPGLDLSEVASKKQGTLTVVTGKVELKNGGKGEFEIEMGKAGGDWAIVEIGSAPKRKDDSFTITNWRKVFYEVHAPDSMALPTVSIDGKQHVDLATATKNRLTALFAPGFIEAVLASGVAFEVTDEMKPAHLVPGSFVGRTEATIFQLSDNQAKLMLGAWPRPVEPAPLARLILCDKNLYAKTDGGEGDPAKPLKTTLDAAGKRTPVPLPKGNWLPRSDHDGSKIVITWVAKHTPAPQPPTLTITDLDDACGGTDKKRIIRVTDLDSEQTDGTQAISVTFSKPAVGNIPTALSKSDAQALKSWVAALATTPAERRRRGNTLRIEVAALDDQGRKGTRVAAVKQIIQDTAAAYDAFDPHPALDDAGKVLKGSLDPDVVVDMTRSTSGKIVIRLPEADPLDPGSLYGAEDDAHTGISITVKYHMHGSGLGTAYRNPLRGDLLVVNNPAGQACTADTIVHEMGHLFGLTPYNVANDAFSPGVQKRKSFSEADDDWKTPSNTKGHYYDAHGHTGSHCAYGLTDTEKGEPKYNSKVIAGPSPQCVMYGDGPSVDANRKVEPKICPQCAQLMRARDYTSY